MMEKTLGKEQDDMWQIGNVLLYDGDKFTGQRGGVVVKAGRIVAMGPHNTEPKRGVRYIDGENHALCPGLIDARVRVPEISQENLSLVAKEAMAGGVTTVFLHVTPNANMTSEKEGRSQPTLDSPERVQMVKIHSVDCPVRVIPVVQASHSRSDSGMIEVGRMKAAGVNIFGDAFQPLASARDVMRWLEYARPFDVCLWEPAEEPSLCYGGSVCDGDTAFKMGLLGRPAVAERILIERDVALLEVYGGRMIVGPISSREGVHAMKAAHQRTRSVTGVTAWTYLLYDAERLDGYNQNFKVFPPLRGAEDVQTLRAACLDSSSGITMIVSDHIRHHRDAKRQPFGEAAVGRSGVADFLNSMLQVAALTGQAWHQFLPMVTRAPAQAAGLESGVLAEGAPADLLVFQNHLPDDAGDVDPLAVMKTSWNNIHYLSVGGRLMFRNKENGTQYRERDKPE